MFIQEKLNEMFESKITFYEWDLMENRLCMELELLDDGVITNYNLEFLNISTFYFVNNTTDERKNIFPIEEGDYLELTSINIVDVIDISLNSKVETWVSQYCGKGNIILEIWSKLIVLEIERIKINNEVYNLSEAIT